MKEDIIQRYDSGRCPFKVPDGYFEDFNSHLMERLKTEGMLSDVTMQSDAKTAELQHPAAQRVAFPWARRLTRYAAAAVITGICVVSVALFYSERDTSVAAQMAELDFAMTDDEVDAVLDSEMMNNSEIAYYLTEAY